MDKLDKSSATSQISVSLLNKQEEMDKTAKACGVELKSSSKLLRLPAPFLMQLN